MALYQGIERKYFNSTVKLPVNIDKVTILYYYNVVSMVISLLFHPFHVAEIKKIK